MCVCVHALAIGKHICCSVLGNTLHWSLCSSLSGTCYIRVGSLSSRLSLGFTPLSSSIPERF